MDERLTEIALEYLDRGWSVIPVHTVNNGHCSCGDEACPTPGKHPRIRWGEYAQERPLSRQIRAWFNDVFYQSNIGLVTGSISNILVVDLDGQEGLASSQTYLQSEQATLTAITGGGGKHLFYRTNGALIRGRSRIFPGVDIKAERGFVVLSPSIHKSGKRYEWANQNPVASLSPSALMQFNFEKAEANNGDHWYDELLEGVQEGSRSNAAVKLAGRYFGVRLNFDEVMLLMTQWNVRNMPPLSGSELKRTVKAVCRKHQDSGSDITDKSVQELLRAVYGKEV